MNGEYHNLDNPEKNEMFSEIWRFTLTFEDVSGEFDKEPYDLKRYICDHLTKEQRNSNIRYEYNNPVYELLAEKIAEHFDVPEYDVVLTNYQERKGSFVVEFAIFAVIYAGFISYGSFRQSLDYLKRDLKDLDHFMWRKRPLKVSVIRQFIERRYSPAYRKPINNTSNQQTTEPPLEPPYIQPTLLKKTWPLTATLVALFLSAILDIFNVRIIEEEINSAINSPSSPISTVIQQRVKTNNESIMLNAQKIQLLELELQRLRSQETPQLIENKSPNKSIQPTSKSDAP